jgi:hypothetical protein
VKPDLFPLSRSGSTVALQAVVIAELWKAVVRLMAASAGGSGRQAGGAPRRNSSNYPGPRSSDGWQAARVPAGAG